MICNNKHMLILEINCTFISTTRNHPHVFKNVNTFINWKKMKRSRSIYSKQVPSPLFWKWHLRFYYVLTVDKRAKAPSISYLLFYFYALSNFQPLSGEFACYDYLERWPMLNSKEAKSVYPSKVCNNARTPY